MLVHGDFLGLQGQSLNEVKVGVSCERPKDPEERLFVLVVGLGGDVKVLQIALAVEGDLAGLNFSVLLVHLVPHQHDGDIIADASEVLVPLGHIFVSDPGGHIKHQNGCVGPNVVPFSQSAQFLLPGRVPEREFDGSVVCVEGDGAHLDALGGNVLLLEFASDMALYKGSLAYAAVADEDDLELCHNFRLTLHEIIVTSKLMTYKFGNSQTVHFFR